MTKMQMAESDRKQDASLALDHVSVEIEAVLGATSMTIGELRALAKDEVVQLAASLADPVELRVNGRAIGVGEIVAVGESFGVRITRIGA
ncbi:flagellar motor switch protein FliN/FliY [Sphingopyxis panaciterrae]|nr:flagellar motor switch protein FliN/FliY [Sphingopyxis panaciterrae]